MKDTVVEGSINLDDLVFLKMDLHEGMEEELSQRTAHHVTCASSKRAILVSSALLRSRQGWKVSPLFRSL